jgi:hypothetical protein
MKTTKLLFAVIVIISFSALVSAQKVSQEVKSSAAYAEVILRTTEIESDLEELLVSYTDEFPKVKEARFELKLLQNDLTTITKMKGAETNKLTQALGKLLVRRAQIATDYWNLQNRLSDEHPDTKKAKRKLEIFEKALRQILN